MEFCSPLLKLKNKKTCYTRTDLLFIIKAWNILYSNKIEINKTDTTPILIKKINEKFQNLLNTKVDTYWAWTDIIKTQANKKSNPEIIDKIVKIESKSLRPSQPPEWGKNPEEWLSNFDIIKVLNQYQEISEFKYKFLGVHSIDFGLKKDDKCLFSRNCHINLREILKSNKIKYIGFITNLSKASEPGTHWTSSFFVLDPKLQSFGGYYYDSTVSNIPKDLQPVFKDIKKQAEEIFKKPFNIYYNNKRHQRGNNACGLFSIAFQVRWLLLLHKNKNTTTMKEVITHPSFIDSKMNILRLKYFRPNIITIIKHQ